MHDKRLLIFAGPVAGPGPGPIADNIRGRERRGGEQEEAGGLHRCGGRQTALMVTETNKASARARARAKGVYLNLSPKWTYSPRRFRRASGDGARIKELSRCSRASE